jgi:hypothetical protein
MLNSGKFYFVGFVFSILIYTSVMGTLAYTFISSNLKAQRYTAHKNDFLDVMLVQSSTSSASSDNKRTKGSTTNKFSSSDVKSLFSSINTAKLQTKEVPKTTNTAPSRLKGETQDTNSANITSLLKNLDIKAQPNYNASSTALYDEYKGKIADILNENLQTYIDFIETGPEANVQITISLSGDFSYSIIRLSKNDLFNEKLKVCLEDMKKVTFPVPTNRQEAKFDTIFNIKDKGDL